MQKATTGHDTEPGWPAEEDTLTGWLQLVPLYVAA
jgi:hypothetical protein